jgi:hypothetical protein
LKNGLCLWTKHTPQLGLWSTYRHQFFKELLEHGQSMQWRPWRSRPHRCLWRAHPKQPKQDLKSWMKQRLMQLEVSNISNLTWSRNRKVPRNWDLHCRPGFYSPNWKWTQDSSTAVQCSNCTFSLQRRYSNQYFAETKAPFAPHLTIDFNFHIYSHMNANAL